VKKPTKPEDLYRALIDRPERPARPAGIDIVWVHGELVLDDGTLTAPARFRDRILMSPLRADKSVIGFD
jgi:hypothetical protein